MTLGSWIIASNDNIIFSTQEPKLPKLKFETLAQNLIELSTPLKKLKHNNMQLLDNVFKNNTKALTKVTKDHQKKPKAFLQLSSSTDWQLQSMTGAHSKIAFILDKSSTRHYIV